MNKPVLRCQQLTKRFRQGEHELVILDQVDFQIQPGQSAAILGSSGSGKSTLLHLLGGLDRPTSGEVCLFDHDLSTISERKRGLLRNQHMGFVYQFHHLLGEFTAVENVAMPLLIGKVPTADALRRAAHCLTQMGLKDRLHHKPGKLSGGERQRTAIARALVSEPDCLLADEPTGNLDGRTAARVFASLLDAKQNLQTAMVIVTHDESLAQRMDSIWRLQDGQLRREA